MRALQLLEWKRDAELVEVPTPTPGPGQVLVRIGAAGACHSDLHLMHDFEPGRLPWALPFTLGHENAGWVESTGAGVTTVKQGDAVAVYGPWGCGRCTRCSAGIETYCERPLEAPVLGGGGGLGANGGMAEFMVVPHERFCVPLPGSLDPVAAAPLTDAGLTPYHAVRRSWSKLPPGATAVVIGVGGLGHMAIQILKATTAARILAVDTRDSSLALARSSGADHVLISDAETPAAIRDLTGGRGADVVLDFVGSESTIATARTAARMMGDVTIVGLAGGSVPFSFFSQPYEVSLQTTYWGTRPELVELLDLAARGLVRVEHSVHSLTDAPRVYRDLAEGKVKGRAVIVP